MNRINVALIGYGLAGSAFHAPMINSMKEFDLKTIYTTNKEKESSIRERYPKTAVTAELAEIFKDKTIDLIVVATPNEFHYPLAAEAIAANKNVVVDKPFTITSQDADRLIEAAQ